jgi:hypothetical protein
VSTLRKSVALLCVAVIVLTALIPYAAFVATPLIELGAAADDEPDPQWGEDNSTFQPALLAFLSSGHLPRASLLPARS